MVYGVLTRFLLLFINEKHKKRDPIEAALKSEMTI